MNSFRFCLCEKVYLLFTSEEQFCWIQNSRLVSFFSFNTLNISLHTLFSIVSDAISTVILASVYQFPRAAKLPQTGCLKTNLFFHNSGGLKSEIKVLAGPLSFPRLQGRMLPCLFHLLVAPVLVLEDRHNYHNTVPSNHSIHVSSFISISLSVSLPFWT